MLDKLLSKGRPEDAEIIEFQVLRMPCGSFGVYANDMLITHYITDEEAQSHCQRLRKLQADDSNSSLPREAQRGS